MNWNRSPTTNGILNTVESLDAVFQIQSLSKVYRKGDGDVYVRRNFDRSLEANPADLLTNDRVLTAKLAEISGVTLAITSVTLRNAN